MNTPLFPRLESPILLFEQRGYVQEYDMHPPMMKTTKKRNPYALVLSKLIFMFLQHLNKQVDQGIMPLKDVVALFQQRQLMIPIMVRSYCQPQTLNKAIHYVCDYPNIHDLLDIEGLEVLEDMTFGSKFFQQLDNDLILRKFYTHVDLSKKKEETLYHICSAWQKK